MNAPLCSPGPAQLLPPALCRAGPKRETKVRAGQATSKRTSFQSLWSYSQDPTESPHQSPIISTFQRHRTWTWTCPRLTADCGKVRWDRWWGGWESSPQPLHCLPDSEEKSNSKEKKEKNQERLAEGRTGLPLPGSTPRTLGLSAIGSAQQPQAGVHPHVCHPPMTNSTFPCHLPGRGLSRAAPRKEKW